MYLYVTENIDYYHKIGIAEDYYARLKNYRTLIPDLVFDFHIPLLNKKMGELFERTCKSHLRVFRLGKSECYKIDIDSIKKSVLGYTLLIQYPVVDYNINPYDYPAEFQFSDTREAFYEGTNTSVVFLNEIYFGSKIPLIKLEKLKGKKIRFNVIKNITLEELADACNKIPDVFNNYKISLNNKLSSYLQDLHNTEHEIDFKSKDILNFLSKYIWKAISDYFIEAGGLIESKKIISINSINKKKKEDFLAFCVKYSYKTRTIGENDKLTKIPGTYILDISSFKRLKPNK